MKLTWKDKRRLEKYADELIRAHPELNKKYPTHRIRRRRNRAEIHKDKTYVVDFKEIEDKAGAGMQRDLCLNDFERKVYKNLCIYPNLNEVFFELDFQSALKELTNKQRFVFKRRIEGNTQQEIAGEMNISRKNTIKHLSLIKKKIEKYWRKYENIYDNRFILGSVS